MKRRKEYRKQQPRRIKRVYFALLLIILALLSGWAMPFSGVLDRLLVPGEPCTLEDQIIASNMRKPVGGCPAGTGNDVIELLGSIKLTRSLPRITSKITVEGNGHTIDGNGKHQIFDVYGDTLRINDLAMTGGNAYRGGAVKLKDGATLILYRSTIRDSTATYGGAISSENSSVTIMEGTFSNNDSERHGGAIYSNGYSNELVISGSTFVGNSSEYGGGLYKLGSQVRIHNSTFKANSAMAGAGIYGEQADTTIIGGMLEENRALTWGGAVYSYGGTLTIETSGLIGNVVTSYSSLGGAISGNETAISISDSEIADNRGARYGGAIQIENGSLDIYRSNLHGNSAIFGGAIYGANATINTDESALNGNFAAANGGSIHAIGGSLSIKNSEIKNNRADYGGGVSITDVKTDTASNSGLGNRTDDKSVDAHVSDAYASVTDSIFSGNTASVHGGAIYSRTRTLTVENSTIIDNAAKRYGGAIYNIEDASLHANNSTIAKNVAKYCGGAIYVRRSEATFTHVTVVNNSSDHFTGGIYKHSGTLNLRNSIVGGNAGEDCSGELDENVNNLIEDGSCDPILSDNPMLAPLDAIPSYYALANGSPATDAGHEDYCLATDQRGTPRPQGEACDIGAIEYVSDD